MKARIGKLVMSLPGVMDALQAPGKAGARGGLPKETTQLVLLRASSPPPARGDDQFWRARGNWPSPHGSSK